MDTFVIDHDRKDRVGFPEIIYGETKTAEVLGQILRKYQERGENALITKLQKDKAATLFSEFPGALFDEISGIFMLDFDPTSLQKKGIAIVAAGTSDLFVVNEIYYTLAFLGVEAPCIMDVGVSGVHRLFARLEELKTYRVLIVVAGFEGALPTVMGGLLPQPIIAVPTSIGYGVAADGRAALSSMLASCANGLTVVNIDNGYGAAMAAFRIINQMERILQTG